MSIFTELSTTKVCWNSLIWCVRSNFESFRNSLTHSLSCTIETERNIESTPLLHPQKPRSIASWPSDSKQQFVYNWILCAWERETFDWFEIVLVVYISLAMTTENRVTVVQKQLSSAPENVHKFSIRLALLHSTPTGVSPAFISQHLTLH